eukprot:1877482-Amphidinium_carterae.1
MPPFCDFCHVDRMHPQRLNTVPCCIRTLSEQQASVRSRGPLDRFFNPDHKTSTGTLAALSLALTPKAHRVCNDVKLFDIISSGVHHIRKSIKIARPCLLDSICCDLGADG